MLKPTPLYYTDKLKQQYYPKYHLCRLAVEDRLKIHRNVRCKVITQRGRELFYKTRRRSNNA